MPKTDMSNVPTQPMGDYYKELQKRLIMQTKNKVLRGVTQSDIDRNEAVRKDNLKVGDMAWFEVSTTPAQVEETDNRNAFEDYQKLADCLLHAANFWKTDSRWSETLGEINNVCTETTSLQEENKRLREALEKIVEISDSGTAELMATVILDIARNALKQNR